MLATISLWSMEELSNMNLESVDEKRLRRFLQINLPQKSESSAKVSGALVRPGSS
jgi:hypothetical protein